MGYDRGPHRSCSTARTAGSASRQRRRRDRRAQPDVLVPSDRDIPRSVNEGEPIVSAKTPGPRPRRPSARSPRSTRRRRRRGVNGAPRPTSRRLREEGLMELHERLSTRRPAPRRPDATPSRRSRTASTSPSSASSGPQLFNAEIGPGGAARPRPPRHPEPPRGGAGPRRTTASGSPRRSPTTSSATARSSGCWPTTASRRSWSTARTTSGSSARAALRDDRPLQRRVAPAADHQQDRRPGRPARRRVVADGRRAPARRQPRQRGHPPLSLTGPLLTIRKFSKKRLDLERPDPARDAQRGDRRVPRALRRTPS